MESTSKMGMNRTGIQMSPIDAKKMAGVSAGAAAQIDSPPHSAIRESYLENPDAFGSVPIPTSLDGMLESAVQTFKGHAPQVLLDKLGERLAFERSGVRLYEALLARCMARLSELPDGMLDTLIRFKNEEAAHFKLVHDALQDRGGDPTAETPCATVAGVAGSGLVKVLTDPRATVAQCLHAILSAELIDNAGWEELSLLARQLGEEELADQFQDALREEEAHLAQIREWVTRATINEALKQRNEVPATH